MKLNKLTSAVSVSLLAVALTACGSDDDAPIIGSTPAPTTTTPAPTPAPVDNTAKIAEIKANAIAAGLTDANATAFANASVNLPIGSDAYNAALREALANQNKTNTGDSNNVVSPVVVDKNFKIPGVDATKQATVTANQYSRREGSTFDRTANPEQLGGLGAVGTDDPTVQNPYLSNYVLAVEVTTDSTGQRKVVAIDSTGEMAKGTTGAGTKVGPTESPYTTSGGLAYSTESNNGVRHFHYGDTSGALTPVVGEFTNNSLSADNGATGKIKTIQEVNVNHTPNDLAADASAALAKAKTGGAAAARDGNGLATAPSITLGGTTPIGVAGAGAAVDTQASGLIVYTSASINAAGNSSYKVPVYGVEENVYTENGIANPVNAINTGTSGNNTSAVGTQVPNSAFFSREVKPTTFPVVPPTGAGAPVASQFNEAQETPVPVTPATTPATSDLKDTVAVANNFKTRVFGKNYDNLSSGKEGSQSKANTYIARYNSKDKLGSAGVTATTLQNVQYGRLTNNIDVLTNKKDTDPTVITYRQFQEHGAANSVDTYFYRGTNHTTLAQMDAVKARGGSVQYFGHALTYGIGPKVDTNTSSNNLPTAYGASSTESTIGNFVQAKYDIAKSTVDGSIYNYINQNATTKPNDFTRQDLVTFSGNVVGNTVVGTSTKLGAKPETGSLTASFFGANANEIGGQVSSIQRSEGYNTPKWGAVFGATRGTTIENFNVIEQGQ